MSPSGRRSRRSTRSWRATSSVPPSRRGASASAIRSCGARCTSRRAPAGGSPPTRPLRLETAVLAASLEDITGRQEDARALLLDELAALGDQRSAEAAELNRVLALSHFPDAHWSAVRRCARAAVAADCDGMVRVGALSVL